MSADRIAKIVTNLKNFASPSDTIEMRPTNINAAVENAAHLALTTARKSGVDLNLDLDDDLPVIDGHTQSVEQITLNLILNAMEAIDHDQGKIKAKTRFQQKRERVHISVADNGHGINPDISDNIFDPFVTDKQAEGGTGLGLSVTYNLVHALNGEITFKSQRGKGSTFNLFFPTSTKKQPHRVLVVDDDDMTRSIVVQCLLKDRTFKIEEASNGFEALVKLESNPPELLILDIFMPGMDGLEVCRVIKNNPDLSEMKVIIITGFPEHTMLRAVSELGFSNIYAKPIDLMKLGKEVDRMFLEG
jgi:CheY-like chemotaxis protein